MIIDYKLGNPRLNEIVNTLIKDTKATDPYLNKIISNSVEMAFGIGVIHQIKIELKKLEDI